MRQLVVDTLLESPKYRLKCKEMQQLVKLRVRSIVWATRTYEIELLKRRRAAALF